jgi:hypothetical protein
VLRTQLLLGDFTDLSTTASERRRHVGHGVGARLARRSLDTLSAAGSTATVVRDQVDANLQIHFGT